MTAAAPRDRKSGLRWHLREATSGLHAEADQIGAGYDLGNRAGYAAFLTAHARAVPGLEAALDAAGLAQAIPDWPQRRRRGALESDLARLGLPAPVPLAIRPFPAGAAGMAQALGAAYVLEGSRLGNGMLLRAAQSAPALAGCGAFDYLSHPSGTEGWPGFLARLEQALPGPSDWPAATEGARNAFQTFLAAMRARPTPAPESREFAAP